MSWVVALVGHKIMVVVVHNVLALELVGDGVRKKLDHSFQNLLQFN